jgi:hypothetical protein
MVGIARILGRFQPLSFLKHEAKRFHETFFPPKNIRSHLLRNGNHCKRQRITTGFDEIDDLFVCGSLNIHPVPENEENLI